jgi:hypothetical protein
MLYVLLGLGILIVGFIANDVPYSGIASAFSRCSDKYGEVQAGELVDWFIGMVQAKSS